MATVGILGGMGPLATVIFNGMLINAQAVECEQEYLDVLVYNKATLPDRTEFILGKSGVSPEEGLVHSAKTLEGAGADFIAIPCMTAHYFYDAIAAAVNIPVINAVEEVARGVAAQDFNKVGLLATDGTLHARIFHDVLQKYGIEVITPEPEEQENLMNIVYKIKQGMNIDGNTFDVLKESLFHRGVDAVILGCTELSLITGALVYEQVDAMATLARVVLRFAEAGVSRNA